MNNYKFVMGEDRLKLDGQKGEYTFDRLENYPNMDFSDAVAKRRELELLDAINNRLPLGSVITKEDVDEKYMIIGYDRNNFDYVLCKYPDGIQDNGSICYINKEQVVRIYFVGCIDNNGKNYQDDLQSIGGR